MAVVRAGSTSAARLALGLLLAGSGCGFDGELPTPPRPPSPPSPPGQAAIALSLGSSPINANVVVDGSTPWSAQWTVGVRETAGVGGAIDFVHATLADSSGASIAETELDAGAVGAQLGGSNRIPGGSTQSIPMSLEFDFPEDVLYADLHVTLQLSDDRGNIVSASADDVIQACAIQQLAPSQGAILDNGCTNRENGIRWEFDWSDCPDAQFYEFYLQQRGTQEPRVDARNLTSSSFTVLESGFIFEEARTGWFWKVRSRIDGIWSNWSPERDFEVEPVDADCATAR
jgi:hypothetical protein